MSRFTLITYCGFLWVCLSVGQFHKKSILWDIGLIRNSLPPTFIWDIFGFFNYRQVLKFSDFLIIHSRITNARVDSSIYHEVKVTSLYNTLFSF